MHDNKCGEPSDPQFLSLGGWKDGTKREELVKVSWMGDRNKCQMLRSVSQRATTAFYSAVQKTKATLRCLFQDKNKMLGCSWESEVKRFTTGQM